MKKNRFIKFIRVTFSNDSIMSEDMADLLFRVFFCSIFFILGMEHMFRDDIILKIMPNWFPLKKTLSIASGFVILSGASFILLGFQSRLGAIILGGFLIVVTVTVHAPAIAGFGAPPNIPQEWYWLWDLFQRSNFVKNLCLLGVCSHLIHHKVGKYSLDYYLSRK